MNRRTLSIGVLLLGTPIVQGACTAQEPPMGAWGITAVEGLEVGHHTLDARPTGCTVVLARNGAVGGVDVRGSAPGSREIALLDPVNTVERVNAVVLSGGSAFGLATADGVMRYLDELDESPPSGRTTMGWRTPSRWMEWASPASASSSNCFRGWFGFIRIAFSGISLVRSTASLGSVRLIRLSKPRPSR